MFEVTLLRPVRIEGQVLVTGARLRADANAAHEWIVSGRARLTHDADLPRLIGLIGAAKPAPLRSQ